MSAYISSIGTAVPPHRISQKTIADFMIRHLPLSEKGQKTIEVLYRASGIQFRHSVIEDFGKEPQDFTFFPQNEILEPFPPVSNRMKLYEEKAIELCEKAARKCLGKTKVLPTHLITVSCTGMYAPGIDIELIDRLGFPTDIQRTSINFMGCYASFNALKVANEIVRNNAEAKVLIVAVELCSIHLLKKIDEDSLLSNALFGDGAAAVLVEGVRSSDRTQLHLEGFYSNLDLEGKKEMSWHISDFGFQMTLSAEVPEVIKKGIGRLTEKLLTQFALSVKDVQHFAIHPGGKRILETIESQLGLCKEKNRPAYHILKNYGNMSSPTVLFVLKEIFDNLNTSNTDENILSFAFGPGLTLESMLLKVS